MQKPTRLPGWREHLHEIIFEADTPAGKAFDVGLLVVIVLSIAAVLLESVAEIRTQPESPMSIPMFPGSVIMRKIAQACSTTAPALLRPSFS